MILPFRIREKSLVTFCPMLLFIILAVTNGLTDKTITDLHHSFYTLTLSQTSLAFYVSEYKSFENTVGKGEIAHSEQFLLFLLFPTVFSTHLDNFLPLLSNLELLSAKCLSLEESKICHLGKG